MRSPAPRALLATAAIAVALAAADTYVVVLALTDMMAGVGVGIGALQQATPIISGFLLGYVAVLPLIGRIADLTSRQKVLLWCLIVFVAGSALTALAHDLPTLVAGRVVQGVGGGGLVPATLAIVGELWPPDRRGVPLGIVGAVQEIGSVVGPLLGALVLAVADWRAIFWLNAVLGVLLALMVLLLGRARSPETADPRQRNRPPYAAASRSRSVLRAGVWVLGAAITALALAAPESLVTSVAYGGPFVPFEGASSRLLTPIGVTGLTLLALATALTAPALWPLLRQADLPGALLLGGALGCIVVTFAAAEPEREVVGPLGYALLPVAALLTAGFLWHQRRPAHPVVPRGPLPRRSVIALVVSLLVGVALVAGVVDVPVLAHLTHTDSQVGAAFVLVRFLIAVPVGAFLGGAALRRCGDGLVTAVGLALAAAGLAIMATWGEGSLRSAASYVVLVAVGLGVGLALAPVNNTMLAETGRALHGTVSSLVVVARMVGMVVGLAVLTGIGLHAYYREVEALPDRTDGDALLQAGLVQVHAVFIGAALAAALGAALAVALGVRRRTAAVAERIVTIG
ncbi:MFS transporter [Blastococcus sp. Marseille-P5729]|uniref:MFS transporter n=1 Tax=Blastococcus sp. Marseille-P5729 TaxID=2086582 RepID=UPI000D112AD1|nr:MFS transporter [Blastococcus sp. Marseille-P5729]